MDCCRRSTSCFKAQIVVVFIETTTNRFIAEPEPRFLLPLLIASQNLAIFLNNKLIFVSTLVLVCGLREYRYVSAVVLQPGPPEHHHMHHSQFCAFASLYWSSLLGCSDRESGNCFDLRSCPDLWALWGETNQTQCCPQTRTVADFYNQYLGREVCHLSCWVIYEKKKACGASVLKLLAIQVPKL